MKYKISELEGALLDAAVASCGEVERADELFPTMTLDPRFSGWVIVNDKCILQPSNPMRQDPKPYSPSTEWWIGGPIIQREHIELFCLARGGGFVGEWLARTPAPLQFVSGPTPLIAAMRAYCASKFGEEIEL